MCNPYKCYSFSAGLLLNQTNLSADPFISKIPHEDSANLKSTSLIMRTIKSASQFDEAMKSLTISGDEQPPLKSLVNNPSISKTSSSSSCYSDGSIVKLNSISTSSSSTSSSLIESTSIGQPSDATKIRTKFDSFNGVAPPIAAPRIKKIGSSSTGLSHQLSQLRRIYEAADQNGGACVSDDNEFGDDDDDDDATMADNEVKRYLAAAVSSSEENASRGDMEATTEVSGSWSRVRARRNVIKQERQEASAAKGSHLMSIQLHSPTNDSFRPTTTTTAEKPVAKPRNTDLVETNKSAIETIRKQFDNGGNEMKLSRFRPVNGARKLKEHELSYFGLNVQQTATTQQQQQLPNCKRDDGKLCSDKPDLLLNHTPKNASIVIAKPEHHQIKQDPIYENLKDSRYRKASNDRQRDEQNLKELNEAADEIKKVKPIVKQISLLH